VGWITGVQFPAGTRIFLFALFPDQRGEAYPASCLLFTGSFSLGLKWPELGTDHTPKVANVWHYIFTHLYIFMVWCLIKYRGNFTVLLFKFIITPDF
jgi:hypothetical protein